MENRPIINPKLINRFTAANTNYPTTEESNGLNSENIIPLPENKIKVLYIEDSPTNLKIMRQICPNRLPYQFTFVTSGQEAINFIKQLLMQSSHEKPVHIIFADEDLRAIHHDQLAISGSEASKRINSMMIKYGLDRIPIISISEQSLTAQDLLSRDIDHHIGKTTKTSVLKEMVNKYVLTCHEAPKNPSLPDISNLTVSSKFTFFKRDIKAVRCIRATHSSENVANTTSARWLLKQSSLQGFHEL